MLKLLSGKLDGIHGLSGVQETGQKGGYKEKKRIISEDTKDSEKKQLIDNNDVLSLSADPTGPSDYPNS